MSINHSDSWNLSGLEYEYELRLIVQEYISNSLRHDPIHSEHEGYALLAEELDELWDLVKKKPEYRDKKAMRKEAVQIAALAMRFAVDLTQE